jgi:phage portal protein BeeE
MIHIRQNAVINPFIGIGNIAKMRLIAEGDIAATEYLNSFLVDSMQMPLNIVLEKGAREGADMQRYQAMLKAKYSKRMGYLNGDDISIVQSSLLQKDFDFIGIQAGGRQTQLSVFGVPPIVAGIPDDSNKATSGNQFAGYYGSTINPILRELADEFTRQHVWLFDKNIKLQFKMHPSADIMAVKDMLQNGIISPNRAAELMGEEFDLADDTRNAYYFPSTYLPIGYMPPEPATETPAPAQAPEEGKLLSDPRNLKSIVDYFVKNSLKDKHFQRFYLSASDLKKL